MRSDLNKTFSTCILKHFRNAPCIFTVFSNMIELRIFSWGYLLALQDFDF